jgi:hypothetical protein
METHRIIDANPSEEIVIDQRTMHFRGDTLLAALTNQNNYFVSIKTVCDALDLNTKGQIQRIKRTDYLVEYFRMIIMDTAGGHQQVACIHIDGIEIWLVGLRLRQQDRQALLDKNMIYQRDLSHWIVAIFAQPGEDIKPRKEPMLRVIQQQDHQVAVVNQEKKMLSILSNLPTPEIHSQLVSTVSQVDQSIREATFAMEDQWDISEDMPIFRASNKLQVYLGTPNAPLRVDEAQGKIRQLGGGTILTARIAMGLWNLRRHDTRLAINGSVAVRLDEILAWRGLQKHSRSSYGIANKSLQDSGYRVEQRLQVLNDFELLSSCCVRGQCTVGVQQRKKSKTTTVTKNFYIDGPYWRYSTVKTENLFQEEEVVGIFLSPGDWILTYETYTNDFFAEIDRRVFALNPQSEQHELRLALYLVERWRQQQANTIIEMQELLEESMIVINQKNITRLISRIEDALTKLWKQGILGAAPYCLTDIDRSKTRWTRDWLTSQWQLIPPHGGQTIEQSQKNLYIDQ